MGQWTSSGIRNLLLVSRLDPAIRATYHRTVADIVLVQGRTEKGSRLPSTHLLTGLCAAVEEDVVNRPTLKFRLLAFGPGELEMNLSHWISTIPEANSFHSSLLMKPRASRAKLGKQFGNGFTLALLASSACPQCSMSEMV